MLHRFSLIASCLCFILPALCMAENVVWSGKVNANGAPTQAIPLVRLQNYQIKVSGYVNLGKWVQHGEKLANDACYQFNDKATITDRDESVKNSANITVCDGKFHPDHVYMSAPFKAEQDRIHFWVSDLTYDDNEGEFHVEIIEAPTTK